jgi:hypothetical protein
MPPGFPSGNFQVAPTCLTGHLKKFLSFPSSPSTVMEADRPRGLPGNVRIRRVGGPHVTAVNHRLIVPVAIGFLVADAALVGAFTPEQVIFMMTVRAFGELLV